MSAAPDEILDVDLLRFEQGSDAERAAVVDGVMRSLRTGFVYTSHDVPEDVIDTAYGMLAEFFAMPTEVKERFVAPEARGQTGYTGLLVETAAIAEVADWKEMLNWGHDLPEGHPLKARYPHRYATQILPEPVVPGITEVLGVFRDRIFDLQRRFMRIIAVGIGCDERFFEQMLKDGSTLTRAIRYPPMDSAPGEAHVWAAEHGDINLITALPRATSPGLEVKTVDGWIPAVAPPGQVIMNTGMMLEHITNGVLPTGIHRVVSPPGAADARYSVVQFCHPTPWTILAPVASCITDEHPQRFAPIEAGNRLDEVIYEIRPTGGVRTKN